MRHRNRILRLALLSPLLFLAACASGLGPDRAGRATSDIAPLPPMKVFAENHGRVSTRSNRELARDFLDLSFELESGQRLDWMSRFEGPITLRVTGKAPGSLDADLDRLLRRLRNEAWIDVTRVAPDQPANITIEVIPKAKLQRLVPQAACFVAPRVTSWREFRINRFNLVTDWTTVDHRETVAIFLPGDVSPQEVRDCLHEELAQALGPLNDLFRLPDSVFNDDNFHTVLTGFDMIMLRTYYAPELRSGMTRLQASVVLPGILSRINPQGEDVRTRPLYPTPRSWKTAIETALGPESNDIRRLASSESALGIARARRWNDNRLAYSLFVNARLISTQEPDRALANFLEARAIYLARPETQVQAARMSAHLAIFALSSGDPERALPLIDDSIDTVVEAENAALLATLLMTKSESLRALGRMAEAEAVEREALGWGRYGFGSSRVVRRRLAEIAALSPKTLVPRAQSSAGPIQPVNPSIGD